MASVLKQLIVLFAVLAAARCCSDFVFLIDSEVDDSPLGRGLQRRRDLVLKTAQQLDLSSGIHRAAAIVYGKRTYDELVLSSFDENGDTDSFVASLKAEFDALLIRNATRRLLPSIGTSDAVDVLLKKVLFKKRMGSPVVVLVFTDGRLRPNELHKLGQVSALLAKKYYVHTFVVNPESSISIERYATLEMLANGEKNSIVTSQNRQLSSEQRLNALVRPFITCEQFTKSRTLRRKPGNLVKASTASTTTTATRKFVKLSRSTRAPATSTARPFTGRPGCLQDIVLLMDFSGGAVDKREQYLNLASDLVKDLTLGPFNAQVAFVRYSGPKRTDPVFHLRKHTSAAALIAEMQATPSLGGTTRTGAAILDASKEFEQRYGGRPLATKTMIVFTDGYSQDDPLDASAKLQHKIQIHAVAVGDTRLPPNLDQLKSIASDYKSIYSDSDFSKLKQKLIPTHCRAM